MVMPSLWGCPSKPHLVTCLFLSPRVREPSGVSPIAGMSHHQGRACLQEDTERKVTKLGSMDAGHGSPTSLDLPWVPAQTPKHHGKEWQRQAQLEDIIY